MQDWFRLLSENPGIFYSGVFILGLLVGSFLNVVILRLPKMMEQEWREQCAELLSGDISDSEDASSQSRLTGKTGQSDDSSSQTTLGITRKSETRISLSHPNSTCPKCGHAIKPWENVPVISYLVLRGKCSACSTPISVRYPLIEMVTALLSLSIALFFGASWTTLFALLFTWSLIALTVIDFDTQLLPDTITLPLLWLGLMVNTQETFVPLEMAVWGAAAGYLSLWLVYQIFRLLTGKEGMGFGDFKLLAALGAWLGWQMLPLVILLSSLVGAVVGITLIALRGQDRNIPIPFGPYLATAGWIALIWGHQIVSGYMAMFAAPASLPPGY